MFQPTGGSKSFSQTLKWESQFLASIFFFVTIMALLICSNETNITTFHDPNLRNEGTNLREKNKDKKSGEEMQHCWIAFIERPQVQRIPKQTSVLRSKRKGSPLVERRQSLFGQHGPGTVDGALVLAWWWVHVSSFHHIYWGSDHCGHKAGAKCRYKVTRQIVCGESWKTKRLKSMNDGNQRAYVLRSVVQKHVIRLYNPMSGDI